MHIEMLQHFQQVVDAKSISKVANETHISQSALSQMIQKMEDSLGYKLLERSNRGVEPTEMGRIVLKYSNNIIKSFEKMQREMRDLEKRTHTIRINADKSLVNYSLPCALYKIKRRFPNNKYELFSSTTDDIVKEVRNDLCDMGVTNERPVAEDLEIRKIGREKVVLVASKSFGIPDAIEIEQLLQYDLIALADSRYITGPLRSELKKCGFTENDLSILFEVDAVSAVKSSIHNHYGIAFLPYSAVKKELYTGDYKMVAIKNVELYHDIYIINKHQAFMSSASCETVDCFMEMGEDSFC